jgi:hypothetical protein
MARYAFTGHVTLSIKLGEETSRKERPVAHLLKHECPDAKLDTG